MSLTLEDFAPSLSTLNHPQVEVEGSLQSLAVIEKLGQSPLAVLVDLVCLPHDSERTKGYQNGHKGVDSERCERLREDIVT